ncbi:gamma-glutamyl-gamma-aminobutyrate hydrolase family protein [Tuwongella immobilis]|uniref:Uncharacterized protein n=1 Tax=Tuwongella immobilis TaxID=692036 RepID=A0A6C2YQA1_9BACT|nr:gamma-glutamyl-gamma-aminobutyrate hydrolase family protein [Tuwongella immobilis]VIP03195.1 peptidase c26 : Peptidase C26 OS=Isosphaera pallida (strain ATCC 43644 / DSM 9630 / IS1B) GN=Isop_3590 PE=4 SV=1: Peptidase_C26 [Tuwongella immobilis]VTS03672.1 peptidase c26 : Peptidase C26 OS=Isosphaera pallida (strain ATCC 43644 / DSM 9630 / IS1B) GN=Isop_3590 PE=4 SV=1: Peptidase_C26 [Tuwongella immobilis]
MSATTRPLIGINCDLVAATKLAPLQIRLHAGYFDAILAAGGLPIILPPLNKEPEIDALLDRVSGVVLTGGADMDPRRQGLPSHAAVQPMVERRENHDTMLIRKLMQRQIPTLGIGLGMQQLNVATGGSLYLHLPADQPKAMPHFDPSGGPHRHLVNVEPNTQLLEIYGSPELRVNSRHHQAINQVGNGFRIAAKAPDGVVEAIEWTSENWFCMGVQWHPESDTASALDMQLFECFVLASVRASQPLVGAA